MYAITKIRKSVEQSLKVRHASSKQHDVVGAGRVREHDGVLGRRGAAPQAQCRRPERSRRAFPARASLLAGSRRIFPPKICPGRRARRCFLRGRAASRAHLMGNWRRRRRRRSLLENGRGRASGPGGGDGGGTSKQQLLTSSAAGPRRFPSPGRDCTPWRKGTGRRRAPRERRFHASPASSA